jgi:addiction module HigA family antidote
MSGSRTTTGDDDRLDNVHPGAILREDFLIGSDIPTAQVGQATGLPQARLDALLAEREPVDAATDLRLARYFGISEGFFLGLQIDYDLEEERRAHASELDRIVPRAA